MVFHVKHGLTNLTFAKVLYSLDLVPYIRRDRRRVGHETIFCISS